MPTLDATRTLRLNQIEDRLFDSLLTECEQQYVDKKEASATVSLLRHLAAYRQAVEERALFESARPGGTSTTEEELFSQAAKQVASRLRAIKGGKK